MRSAYNHFLQIYLFTVSFIIQKENMHGYVLHDIIFYKHTFLRYYYFQLQYEIRFYIPFYGITISSNIIKNVFIVHKENMQGYILHVTIFYKHTFLRYYYSSCIIKKLFIVHKENMHGYALQVTIFYKHTFLRKYYFQLHYQKLCISFYGNTISNNSIKNFLSFTKRSCMDMLCM